MCDIIDTLFDKQLWNGPKQKLVDHINVQKRLMYYFSLYSGLGRRINNRVTEEFERIAPYHLNNQEIKNQLYQNQNLDSTEFKNRLCEIIKPVYDSAKNQGFKEWVYQ